MNQPVRALRRLPDEGKIGGVCAGIARYVGVDPVLVRLAFVLAAFIGGSGLGIYLVAWLIMPKGAAGHEPAGATFQPPRSTVLGIVGLLVGLTFLFGGRPFGFLLDGAMPLVLIGGGIALLMQRAEHEPSGSTALPGSGFSSGAAVPPGVAAGPWAPPVGAPIDGDAAAMRLGTAPDHAGRADHAIPNGTGAGGEPMAEVPSWASDWYRAQTEARAELGLPPLPPPQELTSAVAPAPAAVRPPRRRRRRRRGRMLLTAAVLLLVGLVTGLLAVAARYPGGVGEQNYRPIEWAAVPARYEIGAGELLVDLTDLPALDANRTLEVRAGVGHIQVLIPEELTIELRGRVGAGQVVPTAGELASVSGLDRELVLLEPGATTTPTTSTTPTAPSTPTTPTTSSGGTTATSRPASAASSAAPRLVLDAQIGAGLIEVIRQR